MAYSSRLELIVDSRSGETSLRRFRGELEGVERRGKTTASSMDLLRKSIGPLSAALGGVFTVSTLRNQIAFADELQKINIRIGASTEALSQYNYVAKLSGVQFNQLTTAWQRQTRRIAEAAEGTGAAVDALERLNLSARALRDLSPEDQFERIAGAMQGVSSASERTALAMKLWDTEGVKLVQIVNQGADAIERMKAEADSLGLTISQQTADDMASFNDEMDRLAFAARGVSQTMLAELVPSMTSGLQSVSEFIDEAGGAENVLDAIKLAAGGVATIMAGRLTTSLTTAAAAKLAATQQAIAYQAALARMAGVSRTAAAATGALNGALALVGGPVGAAIIAAGAIYHFREELGLVPAQAETARDRVNSLTGALNENSEAALKNARSMLEAERQLNQFRQATLAMEVVQQRQRVYAEQEAWDAVGGQAAFGMGQRSEAQQALHELEVSLLDARKAAVLAGEGVSEIDEKLASLRDTLDGGGGGGGTTGAVADQAKATIAAAEAAAGYSDELQDLRRRLQPGYADAERFARGLNTINLALAAGKISLGEYAQLLQALHGEMYDVADVSADTASDMARSWEEASSRIDETFADAFTGALDSFDDFSDQLLDSFKRLLAELAYQATLRPIVVGFSAQLGGALGIPGMAASAMGGQGGGFGGLGSIASAGKNLISGGLGSVAWTGVPTSYAGGWAGSATAGLGTTGGGLMNSGFLGGSMRNFGGMAGLASMGAGLGGTWLGSQMFGKGEHSGTLGTLGGLAGTFFGGPVGSAIGSFLGGALGGTFGHSPTPFSGSFGTRASGAGGFEHMGNEGREGQFYRDSALGRVGFFDQGTERLQRAGTGSKDWADELSATTAEMDNLVASLAQSEGELDAMRKTVQGMSVSSRKANDIIQFALVDRPQAALKKIGGRFGDFVRSLEGDIEEVAATALTARDALALLESSQDRLNLTFESTAGGAYSASFAIAELAGGLDNLSAMQEAYYQAYFSEAERAAHLQEDLAKALAEMGLQLPETRDGFRSLVEAQDLNTEAGREAYVALLSLAGGFDQLQQVLGETGHVADRMRDAWDAFQQDSLRMQQELLALAGDSAGAISIAREQELAAMDESLRPFQERIWALQDEAEALNNYHRELERAGTQLGSALNQIQGFVDQRRGASGTPQQNLEELERQWLEQLSLAQSGDMSALRSITQYADRLMQAGQGYFASGEGFQDIQEQVLSALEGLDNLSAEEFLADEIRGAIEGLDIDQIAQTALDELAALQSLHDTTQSQVSLLVDINQSVISVRDALEGIGAVPSFASGGYHSGGLRLVGERGPELEVTGPSRIFDASTTRSMLSPAPLLGGSDVTELLQDLKRELAATRAENRRLLEQVGKNTGSTASAVMQGNELSARQRNEQLREQRAANRAARITKGGRVT